VTAPQDWDESYADDVRSPWDIGRPQSAFARLAGRGLLSGRVLDAGCGTGEQTLLAAAAGADAVGVDISPRAIEQARRKAHDRALVAHFEVADALNLGALGLAFDTVIDCGLFHVFDDPMRTRYVSSLASVLAAGGTCHLMCFSDQQPGDFGPRRVSQDELRAAFGDGWTITGIAADTFELNPGLPLASARSWLTAVRRT
jgi:SAM-dependent methyltransferase